MDDEDDDTSQNISGEDFAQRFTGNFRSKLKLLKSPDRNESCSVWLFIAEKVFSFQVGKSYG